MREQKGVELRRAGKTYEEIAELVDGWGSPTAARDAILRAIRRETKRDATEIVDERLSELGGIRKALYPLVTANVKLALQWIGKGKDRKPVLCDEDPDPEDNNHLHVTEGVDHHVCYVVPAPAQLGAIEKYLLTQKREADYIGLDFSHGLAKREHDLKMQIGDLVFEWLEAVLKDLELEPEKQEQAKILAFQKLDMLDEKTA